MSKGIYREEVRIFKNTIDIGDIYDIADRNMFTYPIQSNWHYGEIPKSVVTRPYCAFELFGLNVNHTNFAEHNLFIDKLQQLEESIGIKINYKTITGIFSSCKGYDALFGYDAFVNEVKVKFKPHDIFEFKKNIQIKDSNKITVQDAMKLLSVKDFYQFMYDNDPYNGHSKIIGFGGLF